jgi:hypothetical protein
LVRIHDNLATIDPADPTTWPPLLRLRDIVKDTASNYVGILPFTASAFRDAVARGRIKPPRRFGDKILCWDRDYILELQRSGIPTSPPADSDTATTEQSLVESG